MCYKSRQIRSGSRHGVPYDAMQMALKGEILSSHGWVINTHYFLKMWSIILALPASLIFVGYKKGPGM